MSQNNLIQNLEISIKLYLIWGQETPPWGAPQRAGRGVEWQAWPAPNSQGRSRRSTSHGARWGLRVGRVWGAWSDRALLMAAHFARCDADRAEGSRTCDGWSSMVGAVSALWRRQVVKPKTDRGGGWSNARTHSADGEGGRRLILHAGLYALADAGVGSR